LHVRVQATANGDQQVALMLDVTHARAIDPMRAGINAVHDRTLAAGGDYRYQLTDGVCRHEALFARVGSALG